MGSPHGRGRQQSTRVDRHRPVVWLMRLVTIVPVLLGALPGASASARPLTVTITHVECVDDCDATGLEAALESHADLYAKVSINGNEQQTPRGDDEPSIDPYWQLTQDVPSTVTDVPVTIQVWDYDSTSGDDLGDLSPRDNDNNLDFTVNYDTGVWSGSDDQLTFPEACSTGDGGANDEPRLKVCFDISAGTTGDFDGDGIPDSIERFGMPDANGTLTPIGGMQMDPCRKTIAIQIDYLAGAPDHSHRPTDGAINDAVAAMNAAPVAATSGCPYAGFPQDNTGVNLVLDRVNAIPEQEVFTLDDLVTRRDGGNLLPARRPYMHYAVFAHDQATGNSSSGLCCNSNRDFLVTLGRWSNQVGTDRDQAGSILHELGHSLGLGHGGADATNYKPNYLSVMNYSFDPTGIPDPTIPANIDTNNDGTPDQSFRLDYSRSKLTDLNESSLDESTGIGDGFDQTVFWDPTYTARTGAGNAAIDWNNFGGSAQLGYKQDLNLDVCVRRGKNGSLDASPTGDDAVKSGPIIIAGPDFVCNTAAAGDDIQATAVGTNVLTTLTGYDDWSNVKYRAALSASAGGADTGHPDDITFEEAEEIKQAEFALFDPDLTLSKQVDKSDAVAGDTLTYTLTARNIGTGDAKAVTLSDTLPDHTTASRAVGDLAAGAQAARTLSYTVPCSAGDGTVLTNTATVYGTNLLNNPEQHAANNVDNATTTVHGPAMTLATTATSTVNAGEAITYRLTYENAGTRSASSVVVKDVLPAGVYYSTALDAGGGPKPSSVVVNADGTRTLTWNIGSMPASSGPKTIEFRARPTLLALGGVVYANSATLTFTDANGCPYAARHSSATSAITVLPPTRNPMSIAWWRIQPLRWTPETLARVQATDQRYDGALGMADGILTPLEIGVALLPSTPTLGEQLLAVYLNLAERRINAGTQISSLTTKKLALSNVRDAALYAMTTLGLPLLPNLTRYVDITVVLFEINSNISEVY
jgi:uncharacterized repeat protein (TIGR01451 family)